MRYTRPVIATEYNGIRYRSRLEARWAVFFDTLTIKFQYEPRVPRIAYLPDFFIAHQQRFPRSMYFEVKPAEYEPSDTIKPDSLAALHFPVGFLHSLRVPRAVHDGCEHEVFFGGSWDVSHGFCKCSCCGAIGFEFEGRSERIPCPCRVDEKHTDTDNELIGAYRTALGYLFHSKTATTNRSSSKPLAVLMSSFQITSTLSSVPKLTPGRRLSLISLDLNVYVGHLECKYQEYRGRCAYCGRHLFTDLDTYMGSTLDHIIPQKASEPESDANLALACATCNTLKGPFDPREGDSTKTKEQLISRARDHIFRRRAAKVAEFFDCLERHEKV